jgi:RHH-type proline utilization regulon transcriptional repressor/proline dehydrogenase/delta 1-pyrroline-5-carboxylate dehydrogenase
VKGLAAQLVSALRLKQNDTNNVVQSLLQEFSLSSDEGIALMCLAESLLRIPDAATRDALIRDKIAPGDWRAHIGHSSSTFVNAAAWGLLVTGKLVAARDDRDLSNGLTRVVARLGEPVIRKAVDSVMRQMGRQFVAGETIVGALKHAQRREADGFRYSYDMLGEAAMTAVDAARYLEDYKGAIEAIGRAADGRGIHDGPGISIKLSALHPRYSFAQYERVMSELYPRLESLARQARRYRLGLNVDAEESDRLEVSLDLLERLCAEPNLAEWDGIGFVVQAYDKRCPFVIDHLIDLARRTNRRLMVRLVKGAYWDSEIKRAQVDGLRDYPVFTRKVHTDISYLACARKLLAAPREIFPQFATHNAQTLASIYHMAGAWRPDQYEFQCLHGMGEALYDEVVGSEEDGKLGRPCRIYAPVGTHETLLAYLVRRLLENGANSSFVNRIADPAVPIEDLVVDPVESALAASNDRSVIGAANSCIPLPARLFGESRENSSGLDLTDETEIARLGNALDDVRDSAWSAQPTIETSSEHGRELVRNPADLGDIVGEVTEAKEGAVDEALMEAANAASSWAAVSPATRATILARAADAMQARTLKFVALLVREAGKTYANAVAEVREAVDFLRYYAAEARDNLHADDVPLGPVVCISPWNFPLAIFTGQVGAALAAGNVVLAKPAEQTPLVAAEAVRLLHDEGVPPGVLHLLPGRGETVGARLVEDPRVQGVVFTGSTEVARVIQRTLAKRLARGGKPIAFIAETGGVNAMIVDSSALPEQVVGDVLVSAFDSAGQRCSALRVLCLQEDVADRIEEMLRGAMSELRLGNPKRLDVDIGPVIDGAAQNALLRYVDKMRLAGHKIWQVSSEQINGHFVPPTLIAIDRLADLQGEIFGPILHVLRYRADEIDGVIDGINALGYGLTMGVHSRIDATIDRVVGRARVGNVYVNRNMVGAVVGVQPFGGEGLSGTGPKAGGPRYLRRLLSKTSSAVSGREITSRPLSLGALTALRDWASSVDPSLVRLCERLAMSDPPTAERTLQGPTGEQNTYRTMARRSILNLAEEQRDLLAQLAAVLSLGGRAVWTRSGCGQPLFGTLPEAVRSSITLVDDWKSESVSFDAVVHYGYKEDRMAILRKLAEREGPIVTMIGLSPGEEPLAIDALLCERVVSVNTAAAGGNATLMMAEL